MSDNPFNDNPFAVGSSTVRLVGSSRGITFDDLYENYGEEKHDMTR